MFQVAATAIIGQQVEFVLWVLVYSHGIAIFQFAKSEGAKSVLYLYQRDEYDEYD